VGEPFEDTLTNYRIGWGTLTTLSYFGSRGTGSHLENYVLIFLGVGAGSYLENYVLIFIRGSAEPLRRPLAARRRDLSMDSFIS